MLLLRQSSASWWANLLGCLCVFLGFAVQGREVEVWNRSRIEFGVTDQGLAALVPPSAYWLQPGSSIVFESTNGLVVLATNEVALNSWAEGDLPAGERLEVKVRGRGAVLEFQWEGMRSLTGYWWLGFKMAFGFAIVGLTLRLAMSWLGKESPEL